MKNLPLLLSNVKTSGRFFQIFVAFSENLNFKADTLYFFSVDEDYYYALRPQGLDSDSEPDPDEATQLLDYR